MPPISRFDFKMEPNLCQMRLRITLAVIGVLIGISIFFCFGIVYGNWHCAVWGLLSGLFAAVTLYIHHQQLKEIWKMRYKKLKSIMIVGCTAQLAAICGFIAYLSIAIIDHQALTAYGDGYYLAAVWCFMTWKWGFLLFYYSRQYKNLYEEIGYITIES